MDPSRNPKTPSSSPTARGLLRRARAALLILALAGPGARARADSITRPPGAEALGLGGTFTARADTPLALFYNPAGAAQVPGTLLLADLGLAGLGGTRGVDARCDPCFQPALAVSSDLGRLQRWRLLLGIAAERAFGGRRSSWAAGSRSAATRSRPALASRCARASICHWA